MLAVGAFFGWVLLELVAADFFPPAGCSPPQATKSSSEKMLLSVYPIFIGLGVGLRSMTFTGRNESLAQRFHCDKTWGPPLQTKSLLMDRTGPCIRHHSRRNRLPTRQQLKPPQHYMSLIASPSQGLHPTCTRRRSTRETKPDIGEHVPLPACVDGALGNSFQLSSSWC